MHPKLTLNQLIERIESAGYVMTGDKTFAQFPRRLSDAGVISAPVVLIPNEPPVQAECVMIPDVITWVESAAGGWDALKGYVRIEGGAAVVGAAVVHLQFVKAQ